MNPALPLRARSAIAVVLTFLLVALGVSVAPTAAQAAPGDVSAATLQWGVKASFRNYISGPIAHGKWTVAGGVSDATPFGWSNGVGTASSVAYGGSIHFQGHEGTGVPAGSYALDLTVSNVRVVKASGTAASVVVDVVSNSLENPTEFVTYSNVSFASVDLGAGIDASTAEKIAFTNAPATLTADGAAAFAGFYGEGTELDPVSFSWPVEAEVAPAVPTITVSKTTELSPAGETVTVTGTGFLPVDGAPVGTRPPLAAKFAGAYVAFGRYADVWKPSENAATSTRVNGDTAWAVNADDVATVGDGGIAIAADGSFTVKILVDPAFDGVPAAGNFGIYTYAGSGAKYAPFETYTPITFSTKPTIEVSKTAGINPLGETVTVRGYNFTPTDGAPVGTRPPLAGKFAGAYVAFGKYPSVWKPSEGAASSVRVNGDTKWAVDTEDVATVGEGGVAIAADGSFTTELTVSRDFANEPVDGSYGIYTYAGSGAVYAPFETATPVTFTAATPTTLSVTSTPASPVEGGSATLNATVSPAAAGQLTVRVGAKVLGAVSVPSNGRASYAVSGLAKGDTRYELAFVPAEPLLFAGSTASKTVTASPKKVAAGSLTWGVKQSFREYVSGPIAKGSISTSGAGTSGGAFVFGQATGGTFDTATGLGTSKYTGSVRFQGHGGILDLTLANPVVRVDSASRGTLLVSINGGGAVPFATLDLAAATKSDVSGATRWAGVPAALTSQGSAAFSYNGSSFYQAGTAIDPVSFTIGAASSGGGSSTVASFATTTNTPAATAPTSEGITVVTEGELLAGDEVTIEADGFAANEEGILAVIYSDPVVLADDVKADASGSVSWTGRLPSNLTGSHTLTLQGSVDRGVAIEIAEATVTTAAVTCAVDDASITWGFKESFRSYISGSIANGEWTVADGATYEVPNFGFANGAGSYDAASSAGELAFDGSIRFTGHEGVLDTTVANPRVRFIDADTAIIVLDVAGVTQDGADIDQQGVDFVELDLTAATVTDEAGAVTIADAPATLLPAGAAAFGTYETGEEFDPVTIAFTTDPACAAPVVVEDEPTVAPEENAVDFGWLPWAISGLLALVVIALVILLVRRRT